MPKEEFSSLQSIENKISFISIEVLGSLSVFSEMANREGGVHCVEALHAGSEFNAPDQRKNPFNKG